MKSKKGVSKKKLVAMDERFIDWLAGEEETSDCDDHNGKFDRNFVLICETEDREISISDHDTLDDVGEHVVNIVLENSGWQPVAAFDLKKMKELKIHFTVTFS